MWGLPQSERPVLAAATGHPEPHGAARGRTGRVRHRWHPLEHPSSSCSPTGSGGSRRLWWVSALSRHCPANVATWFFFFFVKHLQVEAACYGTVVLDRPG